MQTDLTSTNKMIDTLTGNIAILEQDEVAFLKYVAENGSDFDTEQKAFLADRVRSCTEFLNENISLLNKITEVQADGHLKFLDADPYRIAILRLKAAILQAEAACGKNTEPTN